MKRRITDIDPFAELTGTTDTTNTSNTTDTTNTSNTTDTTNTSNTRFNFVITADNAAFLKGIARLTQQSAAKYINSLLDEKRNGADGEAVKQLSKFISERR